MDALLALDTRLAGPGRGMRSGRSMDDRLVYETEHAYFELLIPRHDVLAGDPSQDDAGDFVVGQVVPRTPEAAADLTAYRLVIISEEDASGARHDIWANAFGEFVIPIRAGANFRIECCPPSGPASTLVFQASSAA